MSEVRFYTSDPGLEVLLGQGPVINIVEKIRSIPKGGRGASVLGLVGAVVNDQGIPNVPRNISSPEDLVAYWGGFKNWLGDGVPAANEGTSAENWEDRGKVSFYWGNLYAQCVGGGAGAIVLIVPDMAIKKTLVDVLVTVTRTTPTASYVLPAGTRFKAAGGYMLATLEDVTWVDTDASDQTVRVRQVSSIATTPVDISTVTVWVDSVPADTTITTVPTTVPESMDAAEVLLRYTAAFNASLAESVGKTITVMTSDRYDATIQDAGSAHVVTAAAAGFFRTFVGCPPPATTAALAETGGADSVNRVGLTTSRFAYVHPGAIRQFPTDAAQLSSDNDYQTGLGHQIPTAFRVVAEPPEANHARPHQLFRNMRIVGEEQLTGGQPDLTTHWNSNIEQPNFDYDQVSGTLAATLFSGVLADGTEMADRRMLDYIYNQAIVRLVPIHKGPARTSDAEAATDSIQMYLDTLIKKERLRAYAIAWLYDEGNNHLVITLGIQLLGNFNVITLEVNGGTSALPEATAA